MTRDLLECIVEDIRRGAGPHLGLSWHERWLYAANTGVARGTSLHHANAGRGPKSRIGTPTNPRKTSHGSDNGNTLLTEADVVAIRARKAAGARNVDLAREFRLSPRQVWVIASRRAWKHVG